MYKFLINFNYIYLKKNYSETKHEKLFSFVFYIFFSWYFLRAKHNLKLELTGSWLRGGSKCGNPLRGFAIWIITTHLQLPMMVNVEILVGPTAFMRVLLKAFQPLALLQLIAFIPEGYIHLFHGLDFGMKEGEKYQSEGSF